MSVTCIIADDEAHLARYLKDQLKEQWPELKVLAVAANGPEAAQAIDQQQPDIAFLDIQMPGFTGLEVAQGIEGNTRVVFVTAYDEYAVQAFEQGAVDYLLKPVTTERLSKTLERIKTSITQPETISLAAVLKQLSGMSSVKTDYLRWVRANVGELTHQISVADVHYFEAVVKYTCVYTAEGEKLIRVPIQELETQLDPRDFSRIHAQRL